MAGNFIRKAHLVNICEQAVHSWKKELAYGDLLSDVNYEKHRKVLTRHLW